MKNCRILLNILVLLVVFTVTVCTAYSAVESKISGSGSVTLTSADLKATKKGPVKRAIVLEAQDAARKAAINALLDKTLGAGASKKPEVKNKFDNIFAQIDTFVIDEDMTGELVNSDYKAKVNLVVDETAFKKLVANEGIAINIQKIRAGSILLIMDEFFTAPVDYNENTPLRDVTTYKYDNNTRYKETEKESSSASASASAAAVSGRAYGSARASAKSNYNYGHFTDFSNNESEFYQHVIEYAPKSPKIQHSSATLSQLKNAFTEYDINVIDETTFKGKYFKGKPITTDKLENSPQLANMVEAARKEAHADFFGIGVAEITDYGKDENSGRSKCSGNVKLKIFSTATNELLASGILIDIAEDVNPNATRALVAKKIGNELGLEIANRIHNYWKLRQMYGSEYTIVIKGNFLPAERIKITKSLKNIEGVQNVSARSNDATKIEYSLNYGGSEVAVEAIFSGLLETGIGVFNGYDYSTNGNNIIFFKR